jgi:hypothetical protein
MTNFKMMITADGKHPPEKWADVAADEIIEISAEAPQALIKEATEFRKKLYTSLTEHIKAMMDHEKVCIAKGHHDLNLHYETEDYASMVVNEICDIAKGTNFESHFCLPHVHNHLEAVCNRIFKSAKLVERQHFHSEKERSAHAGRKTKK